LPTNRSSFVTITAWIFIALTGIGLVISILQNLVMHYYFQGEFPPQEMVADIHKLGIEQNLPAIFIWLILHVKLLFFINFLFIASFFAASIGFLKRLGWARLAVIGLSAIAIAYFCLGLYIQLQTISAFERIEDTREIIAGINQGFGNIKYASYAITAAICAGFAWVAKRLLDDDIASEFSPIK
jgi:hypothetical protein